MGDVIGLAPPFSHAMLRFSPLPVIHIPSGFDEYEGDETASSG